MRIIQSVLFMIVIAVSPIVKAYVVSQFSDFINAIQTCHDHPGVEASFALNEDIKLTVTNDTKGYCLIIIKSKNKSPVSTESQTPTSATETLTSTMATDYAKNNQTTTVYTFTCPLSKQAVEQLTSPAAIQAAQQFVGGSTQSVTQEEKNPLFAPIFDCIKQQSQTMTSSQPMPLHLPKGILLRGTILQMPPGVTPSTIDTSTLPIRRGDTTIMPSDIQKTDS